MYGYYPTGLYGAMPQMQDRLNQMEMQQAQAAPVTLRGRMVTCIEEVKAAQINMDGKPTFFPSPAENKVYEKSIGLDGMPICKVYELSKAPPNPMNALEARVAELEKMIRELVERRENHESIGTCGNVAASAEPYGNVTTNGGK